MTSCTLGGQEVKIHDAIDLKEAGHNPDFRCDECGQHVRPHRAGGAVAAHFEHVERNPSCSQSHVARQA